VIKSLFYLIERERQDSKESTETLNSKIQEMEEQLKEKSREIGEFKEKLKKVEEVYQSQIQLKTKDLTDKVLKDKSRKNWVSYLDFK
jgi:hypothetical protein